MDFIKNRIDLTRSRKIADTNRRVAGKKWLDVSPESGARQIQITNVEIRPSRGVWHQCSITQCLQKKETRS